MLSNSIEKKVRKSSLVTWLIVIACVLVLAGTVYLISRRFTVINKQDAKFINELKAQSWEQAKLDLTAEPVEEPKN